MLTTIFIHIHIYKWVYTYLYPPGQTSLLKGKVLVLQVPASPPTAVQGISKPSLLHFFDHVLGSIRKTTFLT